MQTLIYVNHNLQLLHWLINDRKCMKLRTYLDDGNQAEMGTTYGMQERGKTCKEIFGTNIMGIIEHNIIMYFEEILLENIG